MGHAFPLRPAIVALVAGVTLAGCGRRGPLELPPGAPATTQSQAATEAQQTRVLDDQDTPGLIQNPNQGYEESPARNTARLDKRAASPVAPQPINGPPSNRQSTFFLDPLL